MVLQHFEYAKMSQHFILQMVNFVLYKFHLTKKVYKLGFSKIKNFCSPNDC